jgi:hypothetical protein
MLLLSVRPVDAFEYQMFLQQPPGRTLFVNYCWIVSNRKLAGSPIRERGNFRIVRYSPTKPQSGSLSALAIYRSLIALPLDH